MQIIRTHRPKLILLTIIFVLIPLACNLPTGAVSTPPGQEPTPIDQGPTPTDQPTITPRPSGSESGSNCTYEAQLVSSSLPYGAGLNSAQSFTQTWELKNTGSCPWQEASLQLVTGNSFNSSPGEWPLPETAPGDTARLSLQFQAPQDAGTYRGDWQMVNGKGHAFGPQMLTVAIQVSSSSSTSSGAGAGSSGGSSSGGGGGSGGLFPLPPGIAENLLDPLRNAMLFPDPTLAAINNLYPELSRYLNQNKMPDISDIGNLPVDRFSIDPQTLAELAQTDPVQQFLSGESDDEEPQIGKPPEPPSEYEEDEEPEENAYRVTINGVLKVTEAHRGVRRHTKKVPIIDTKIVVDNHKPSLYFGVSECVSGTNNKGIYGAVAPYVFRAEDGVEILVIHQYDYQNCKNGNGGLFPPYLEINKYFIDIKSGGTHHFETLWEKAGKKGASKVILDFKVEGFHKEITQDGYITIQQE